MVNTESERKKEADAMERLAADLRARRARLNLKQLDVAAIADMEQATVSRIEAGYDTRLSTYLRVVGALGLTVTLTEAA